MRIIATCDLHYNIARSRGPTEEIAREICDAGGDALLLLGDLAGIDLDVLERVFELFERFRGPRLFVAGNHELWAPPGGDSALRLNEELPRRCARHGVRSLEHTPFRDGDTAIVGTVGWYDYGFRDAALDLPLRFYEEKIAPGSASARPALAHLEPEADDVPAASRRFSCRWMDGAHVRLPCTDPEFAQASLARLVSQLHSVSDAARVLVGMHHVPFSQLLPAVRMLPLRFATAFMGSPRFGEMILRYPNVRHVLCGHTHQYATWRKNGLSACAIGSTYVAKRYEVIDV